jgi:hypothetical protein
MDVGAGSAGRVRTRRPSSTSIRMASPSRKPAHLSHRPRRRIIGTLTLASKYEVTVILRCIGTPSEVARGPRSRRKKIGGPRVRGHSSTAADFDDRGRFQAEELYRCGAKSSREIERARRNNLPPIAGRDQGPRRRSCTARDGQRCARRSPRLRGRDDRRA